jgi:hypothetical protein
VSGGATPLARNARLCGQALLLRAKGLTITQIAARLDAPRSTIGGWLSGYGEWSDVRACGLCGEHFIATSPKQRFCSRAHAAKHYRVFGAPCAIEAYRQRAQALEDDLCDLRARIAETERLA